MIIFQGLLCVTLLLFIPIVVGGLFYRSDRRACRLPLMWVGGQMILWAGFTYICVPLILLEQSFLRVEILYGIFIVFMVLLAVAVRIYDMKKRKRGLCVLSSFASKDKVNALLWGVFFLLLLVQLVLSVVLAYEEGDDAFYFTISTQVEQSNTMYQTLPYLGGATGLDARHALAPFPVWIAFLARMTGIPAITTAQVVLSPVFILMAYGISYLLAQHLFGGKPRQTPLFMIFMELLVCFGGYSPYTSENFLIVRAAQGKAVLACLVIPFLFYVLLLLLERLQKKKQVGLPLWGMLFCTMTTALLCSTLGALLICILLGVVGVCAAVCYGRWRAMFAMLSLCIIPGLFAVLYLFMA